MKATAQSSFSKKYNFVQWISVLSAYTLMVQQGIFNGWASPNFARLMSDDSPIPATPNDVSWMVSLIQVGSLIGGATGSILVEYIGSRKTVTTTYILFSISWIGLLVASSIEWLYVSLIIGGIPVIMTFSCYAIYLGEISRSEIRGTFISFATTGFPTGIVLGTIIETYVPSKISIPMYLIQALLGIATTLWLKNTPYYFVKKNNFKSAHKAIEFYRTDVKAEKELDDIINFVEKNNCDGIRSRLRECQTPAVKKSIFLIIAVCALPYLSGIVTIMSYMETILKSAKCDLVNPQEFVIYANVIGVIASMLSMQLVDKIGRKLLVILSSVGTALGMIGLGLHFYLLSISFDAKTLQWLPVGSIIIYLVMYMIGYAPIPGTLLSEMFPENAKSVAAFVASTAGPLCGIVMGKAYQPIVDSVGEAYAFWMHAGFSLLGIPCALFLMIETKGKTFQEIQNKLSRQPNSQQQKSIPNLVIEFLK